ncbi:MAG: hypothetical protein ABJF88_05515 [Rhodothermales bacterium]
MNATPSTDSSCSDLLTDLVGAVQEAAPVLNEGLPFPQRTGITRLALGEVQSDGPGRCSAALALHVAGGVEKRYTLSATMEGRRTTVAVNDEADFEERIALATAPGEPLHDRDVRAVYDAFTTDLAGHFGTEA